MDGINRRLLVIGLDGGTFDVFMPLIQHGYMPNLHSILSRGCWGHLESTIPPFTASAWSSFITGQNPGQHGIISFQTRDRYNYDMMGKGFVTSVQQELTLWEVLSRAGKRLSIVNVPMTYPAKVVNGHMITGMLTPSTQADFVYPPELRSRIGEDYIIDVDFIRDGSSFRLHHFPSEREMIRDIRRMTKVQTSTLLKIWDDEPPWDFAMMVFTGTDRLFHFFWHYVEAAVCNHDQLPLNKQCNPDVMSEVIICIREIDEAIGQLIGWAGDETTILLMSDHGFGPAQRWRFYVNIWLEKQGLLTRRSQRGSFDLEQWRVWIGRQPQIKALLRRIIPQNLQDSATTVAQSLSPSIIDWSKTQAFFVPIYFQICGIEINQKGVFREGIVEPGRAYEKLRDSIIEESMTIQNAETGQRVVTAAYRREEIYSGRYVENFPDVILVLDPEYLGASSMAGKNLIEKHPYPMRSGEHRQNGMFALAGPNISQRGEIEHLRLLDVPPTILYELNVPIPDAFDGEVISSVYSPTFLDTHPIQYQSFAETTDLNVQLLSETEQSMLEDRLRSLGYLS